MSAVVAYLKTALQRWRSGNTKWGRFRDVDRFIVLHNRRVGRPTLRWVQKGHRE